MFEQREKFQFANFLLVQNIHLNQHFSSNLSDHLLRWKDLSDSICLNVEELNLFVDKFLKSAFQTVLMKGALAETAKAQCLIYLVRLGWSEVPCGEIVTFFAKNKHVL